MKHYSYYAKDQTGNAEATDDVPPCAGPVDFDSEILVSWNVPTDCENTLEPTAITDDLADGGYEEELTRILCELHGGGTK